MAERTGLEPATSGVTGRHSNQLNYRSFSISREMIGAPRPFDLADVNRHRLVSGFTGRWVLRVSNSRPSPCKGDALPAELSTLKTDAIAPF